MRPFCGDERTRRAFDAWCKRIERASVALDLETAGAHLVVLLASREVRLEALQERLRRSKGTDLELVRAERLAAGDMVRTLDLVERVLGPRVAAREPALEATGTTGTVVSFPVKLKSATGQRIAAALAVSPRALLKAELRAVVPGRQDQFLVGLAEAVRSGAVRRSGSGRKKDPYRYGRGGVR